MKREILFVALGTTFCAGVVSAQEVTNYTYDPRGRLTSVSRSGGPANGVNATYSYDPADNRMNVAVAGVAGQPSFSISDVSVTEGGNLVYTVTKTGSTSSSFSVNFATVNGTAVAGSDYIDTGSSGTLTFASTETSKTITIATINDTAVESAETVLVNLSGATGGATISDSQGVGTINDNDGASAPSLSISDVSVTEGGNLVYTVTKTGSTSSSFSVNFATANGTAASGSDYTAASGTLTFASSETSKTITVATINDTAVESAETVLVNLSGATGGATISDSQGVGTINDNDGASAPSFSISDVSVTEGGNLVYTVTKTGSTSSSFSVNFATANGTAASGSDYTAASGTLTFASSETSKTITVATINDTAIESAETVLVNLSGATGGATISDSQGVGTINDNDGASAPSFSISDVSVTEGGNLVYTVTKTGSTSSSFSVNFATANGTAASGSDYTAASGTLTFASSETSKTITIATINDTAVESAETVLVNLSGATGGATISDSQGVGTINDNDGASAPSFSISDVSVTEGGNLVYTVTKTGSTSSSFSVNFATVNGTAVAGSDYIDTGSSGTLTFASTETSKTITIATINDTAVESAETVLVNLSGATGGATISDSQGVGTINDNDGASAPSFSVSDAEAIEASTLIFTITKAGTATTSLTVNYATADGTATSALSGRDYTATSGSVTFGASETTKVVSVPTNTDNRLERDETIYLNLSGSVTISDAQGEGLIIDDGNAS